MFFLSTNYEMIIPILRLLREKQGITQKQVAKKMHCTQSKVAKFEKANVMDVNLLDLKRYADAVGMKVEFSIE